MLFLLAAAAGPLLPDWSVSLATIAFANALVVLGLIVLWRAGLVSFGQALYYCVGAYTVALIARWTGFHDAFALVLLGGIAAGLIAALVGVLLARYREIFFAMLSLALSMILYGVLVKSESLGSTDGFTVSTPTFLGFAPHGDALGLALYWLTLGIGALSAVLVGLYFRSIAGSLAAPIRDNEIRVEFLGVSVTRIIHAKVVIAGVLGGLGGALAALSIGHVDPAMSYWTTSGGFVFVTILAGAGSVAAAFVGSLVFEAVRSFAVDVMPGLWQMTLGTVLLAHHPVPAGRPGLARHALAQAGRGEAAMNAVASPILSVRDLEKTFGSLVAARDINVSVPAEQTVGVIGANGAGKTTFINMITGHLTPSKGTILFEDKDITGKPSREITRLGISRSFQVAQVFPSLTVFDNMCVAAAIARCKGGLFGPVMTPLHSPAAIAEAEATIELFQIARYRDTPANTLPQGVRKLLDIGMAVVGWPRLLLLDEPTSGISIEEKFDLMNVVMSALKTRKITVLFVEHDMEIVGALRRPRARLLRRHRHRRRHGARDAR